MWRLARQTPSEAEEVEAAAEADCEAQLPAEAAAKEDISAKPPPAHPHPTLAPKSPAPFKVLHLGEGVTFQSSQGDTVTMPTPSDGWTEEDYGSPLLGLKVRKNHATLDGAGAVGGPFAVGSSVRVIDGPNQGRSGTVSQVRKAWLVVEAN